MNLIEDSPAVGSIRVEPSNGQTLVVLTGEIDDALRSEASMSMALALTSGAPVVIDATDVSFVDSSGIAFVVQLHLAASEAGIPVTLRDPHRVLRDMLDMVGLSQALPAERPAPVPSP